MSDDAPSLADRMAAARAAWQHDVRINRGPAPAEAPAHVPQFISPFRAFEVMHGIEMKETGRRNSISDIRDFEDLVGNTWQSRQMPIEKIRQLPNFVSEQWVLFGRKEDGSAHQVGQFATEDMARDVLGGITGDRKFDQNPAQDWTVTVSWSRFCHEIGDAYKPTLADRMSGDFTDQQQGRVTQAIRGAHAALVEDFKDQLPRGDAPFRPEDETPEQQAAHRTLWEQASDRPHEQIVGQGRQRW